jgi:anaerobic selenocysteine-containing dehydrogenase
MPALPDHMESIELADEQHPFRLVTAPARSYLNSTFTETPTSKKREQQPTALIHPDDCKELNIATGERIQIGNARNTIVVHAKVFDGVQRGVIVIESIWPNSAFEGGIGVNSLIGADAGAPNGGAVFHDSAVWIRRAI